MIFYGVIFVLLLPFLYKSIRTIKFLLLNRNYLQNRTIQDKVNPLVIKALEEQGLHDYFPSEFTQIDIAKIEGDDAHYISLELFILSKKEQKWNVVERKVAITGYHKAGQYYVKSFRDVVNSMDLGMIMPNVSNALLNNFFRPRDWEQQRKYWDVYKRDWDTDWSNSPMR